MCVRMVQLAASGVYPAPDHLQPGREICFLYSLLVTTSTLISFFHLKVPKKNRDSYLAFCFTYKRYATDFKTEP
jgi:hypothetical protein